MDGTDQPGQNRSQRRGLMVLEARFTSQLVHAEQQNNFCLMHYSSVVRREHSPEKALVDIYTLETLDCVCECRRNSLSTHKHRAPVLMFSMQIILPRRWISSCDSRYKSRVLAPLLRLPADGKQINSNLRISAREPLLDLVL